MFVDSCCFLPSLEILVAGIFLYLTIPSTGKWGSIKLGIPPPKKSPNPPNLSIWNGHNMVFPAPNMITYIDPTQFTSK